jgi:hypothetical protein
VYALPRGQFCHQPPHAWGVETGQLSWHRRAYHRVVGPHPGRVPSTSICRIGKRATLHGPTKSAAAGICYYGPGGSNARPGRAPTTCYSTAASCGSGGPERTCDQAVNGNRLRVELRAWISLLRSDPGRCRGRTNNHTHCWPTWPGARTSVGVTKRHEVSPVEHESVPGAGAGHSLRSEARSRTKYRTPAPADPATG